MAPKRETLCATVTKKRKEYIDLTDLTRRKQVEVAVLSRGLNTNKIVLLA